MSRHTITVHLELTFDQDVELRAIVDDLRQPLIDAAKHRLGVDIQPPVIAEVSGTEGPLHPNPTTWTVHGVWSGDTPVAHEAILGEHFDEREDDGTGQHQPWSTFAWASNEQEAMDKAVQEMLESL